MNLSNVESDAMAISESSSERLKNHGYRYENRKRTANGIFLVIDEFAALRITLDRKILLEINGSLRRIILMGRAANIRIIMALQRQRHLY